MSKTTIEYKGVVTTVEAGKSAVIRCDGDKMEDEVVVTAGSGGGGGEATLIAKTITANGTYSASSYGADGFSKVVVNVAGGGADLTEIDTLIGEGV